MKNNPSAITNVWNSASSSLTQLQWSDYVNPESKMTVYNHQLI